MPSTKRARSSADQKHAVSKFYADAVSFYRICTMDPEQISPRQESDIGDATLEAARTILETELQTLIAKPDFLDFAERIKKSFANDQDDDEPKMEEDQLLVGDLLEFLIPAELFIAIYTADGLECLQEIADYYADHKSEVTWAVEEIVYSLLNQGLERFKDAYAEQIYALDFDDLQRYIIRTTWPAPILAQQVQKAILEDRNTFIYRTFSIEECTDKYFELLEYAQKVESHRGFSQDYSIMRDRTVRVFAFLLIKLQADFTVKPNSQFMSEIFNFYTMFRNCPATDFLEVIKLLNQAAATCIVDCHDRLLPPRPSRFPGLIFTPVIPRLDPTCIAHQFNDLAEKLILLGMNQSNSACPSMQMFVNGIFNFAKNSAEATPINFVFACRISIDLIGNYFEIMYAYRMLPYAEQQKFIRLQEYLEDIVYELVTTLFYKTGSTGRDFNDLQNLCKEILRFSTELNGRRFCKLLHIIETLEIMIIDITAAHKTLVIQVPDPNNAEQVIEKSVNPLIIWYDQKLQQYQQALNPNIHKQNDEDIGLVKATNPGHENGHLLSGTSVQDFYALQKYYANVLGYAQKLLEQYWPRSTMQFG